jgi:Spy/CpxP family protein refolding chaperone
MKTLVLAVSVFMIALPLQAQEGPPMRKQGLERVERFRKMRMIEMLDLKEEQSVRFMARFKEFENNRQELQKQREVILDKIERLVRNNADEKEIEKVFPEAEAINRKIGEARLTFFNSLSDLLTIQQRAKLLLFERRFEGELRDAVRQRMKERHPGIEEP